MLNTVFKALKEAGVIDDSYITFIYGEYDSNYNFNYLNDNYNDILGTLILGDSPHIFAPDKYKEEDEIKVNGRYILDIKEIKFISHSYNFSEINKLAKTKSNNRLPLSRINRIINYISLHYPTYNIDDYYGC